MIDLIKNQVLTDKTVNLLKKNVYVFDVDKRLSKLEVKLIFEKVFNVEVISINSYLRPGKSRRLGKFTGLKVLYKRIFVKIKDGKVIPFFSSL